jgi:hypothetical protein
MRDRIVRLREEGTLRREVRDLMNDDQTNFLLSTPELAGEIREAMGSHVTFSFNLTLGAGMEFEKLGGLPKLPPVLSNQCRQEIPKAELDAGRRSEDVIVVHDRHQVEYEDGTRRPDVLVPNVVRGTRFPFAGICETWLLVRLPAGVEIGIEPRKTQGLGDVFRVNPLRFDPR